ncbi:hypothetical protein JDV09_03090 [Mycobacterium sp. Y57]|uniref:hypothetical protein n=1 Tax=Mycolicibacterium xanthum TaxID=2796469 RepID=UPI001C843263|nr:hypothetical protein [Mycolicibacterium xanthum]MBX7431099.1 hypothetical protein [Mycolicibacterium xanthum]
MKRIAVVAIAGGLLAAPWMAFGPGTGAAGAQPNTCDGAACVPFVDHTAQLGAECNQRTRYNFGTDAAGNTLQCNAKRQWVSVAPLVGVRLLRSPCENSTGSAQTPDGVPLSCDGGAWSADYSVATYG